MIPKPSSLRRNKPTSTINVERWRAQKADQCLIVFAREIYRQRRWRGDRRDNRNAGGERFLHDLERGAPADEEKMSIQRQEAVEKSAADCFIDRIMPADIFAHDLQIAANIEYAGGMNASRARESALPDAQACRQRE